MGEEPREQTFVEMEILPEMVQRIEGSDFKIDDKVNLLLTMRGLKPASELDLAVATGEDEKFQVMSEDQVNEHRDLVESTGLAYKIQPKNIEESWQEKKSNPGKIHKFTLGIMKIFVGRTQEELEALMKALEKGDSYEKGLTFGIPETAVEAHSGIRAKLNLSTLPKEIIESEAMAFSTPTLSEDNWQEEIKQGQVWSDFIKKVSPTIHNQYLEAVKRGKGKSKSGRIDTLIQNY